MNRTSMTAAVVFFVLLAGCGSGDGSEDGSAGSGGTTGAGGTGGLGGSGGVGGLGGSGGFGGAGGSGGTGPCADPDQDDDGYASFACDGSDCEDLDASVHPGAVEVCNGRDEDCDAVVDDGVPEEGTPCDGADADSCADGTLVCQGAEGLVCVEEFPGQIESCNGLDDDCDGLVDEDFPEVGQACDGEDPDNLEEGVWICAPDGSGTVCMDETP